MVQFPQQLNALSGPSAGAVEVPRGKRWVLGRGRKSPQCPGRGGRLSSGCPGVDRDADGARWLAGARGLGQGVCGLPAGNAQQGRGGLRRRGRQGRSSLLGSCFVGEMLKAKQSAGPAARQGRGVRSRT